MRASENISLQSNGNLTLINGASTLTWVGGVCSAGVEAIPEIRVAEKGITNLGIAIKNLTAASASISVSNLSVQAQMHADGDWIVLASGTDFTDNRVVKTSALVSAAGVLGAADFAVVGAAETIWFVLAVPAVYNLRIVITSGGGTVKTYAVGFRDDVDLPGTGEDIESLLTTMGVAVGAATDVPIAWNGDDEGNTARSHTSLLKRAVNALKAIGVLIAARIPLLGSAAKAASMPVTVATDDALITLLTPYYKSYVYTVTCGVSATIAELLATPFPAGIPSWVRKITFIPNASGVYVASNGSDASASSTPMLAGLPIPIDGRAADFVDYEFYSSSGATMTLWLQGVAS